jgi:GT2 family glycosyltransferase
LSNQNISVIILSYKKFAETTAACFRSLTLDPQFPEWEVIIVDNASGPDTRQSLKKLADQYSTVRLVLNETNLGFAGGMNAGLREATGDVICLLNSDTMAATGAMGRMANQLRGDKCVGLVGPVTNAAGNEQKIFLESEGPGEQVIAEGERFANCGSGEKILAYRLDFCAVAIKREVVEAIGGLDESFGRGYYEDFDYSLRAKLAGFELEVAEDAFIYHQGSASFGPVSSEMKALIAANKDRITQQHGRSTLFHHVRDANLSVLRQYAEQMKVGQSPPDYRIRNRLKLAEAEQPRSPLKRWRYKRRLASVIRSLELA